MAVPARERSVFSLCEKLERVWVVLFLAFLALSNAGLVLLAYLLLLLCGAATVVLKLREPPPLSAMEALLLILAGALAHLPLARLLQASPALPASYLFAVVAAVAEEIFYRGFLLERLGLPLQALLFMYSHLTVGNPLFLVNSSLLAPHYYLFGLASGLVAEKRGFEGSSVLHVAYNIVALSYVLPLETQTVFTLLASDAMLTLVLYYFYHFPRREKAFYKLFFIK